MLGITNFILSGASLVFTPFLKKPKRPSSKEPRDLDGNPISVKGPPIPLPPRKRGRSLTLDQPRSRRLQAQRASALLSLPPEIRNMVWERLIGGRTIHLWIENRKLSGFVCRCEEAADRQCFLTCWILGFESDRPHKIGVVGLLQSCRKLYSEVINLLYSESTFMIQSSELLFRLPKLVLPQRLDAIRSLRFSWILGYPPSTPDSPSRNSRYHHYVQEDRRRRETRQAMVYREAWVQIWKTLASMQGLVSLTIELNIVGDGLRRWSIEELDVVKSVTRPKYLVLVLPAELSRRWSGRVGGENCQVVPTFAESDDEFEY